MGETPVERVKRRMRMQPVQPAAEPEAETPEPEAAPAPKKKNGRKKRTKKS